MVRSTPMLLNVRTAARQSRHHDRLGSLPRSGRHSPERCV